VTDKKGQSPFEMPDILTIDKIPDKERGGNWSDADGMKGFKSSAGSVSFLREDAS
jgi:hypothetical protein